MSTFKSTTRIKRPAKEIYDFLADMNNHERLAPEEEITDWSSTVDEASFTVRNILKLSLKIGERVTDKEIKLIPAAKPPFNIEMKWALSVDGEYTDVTFTIEADLNIMMKMMASGPLQKLADDESASLFNLLH
jgi:carbon monoxide dehydrogenase subunit G